MRVCACACASLHQCVYVYWIYTVMNVTFVCLCVGLCATVRAWLRACMCACECIITWRSSLHRLLLFCCPSLLAAVLLSYSTMSGSRQKFQWPHADLTQSARLVFRIFKHVLNTPKKHVFSQHVF